MYQLLKYEMIKKWKLFLIVLSTVILAEGFILYQLLIKENWSTPLFVFSFMAFGGMFFVLIDSINSFSLELRRKSGYMLFLTPRNGYQIVGAKVMISLLELFIGFFVYIGLARINYSVLKNTISDEANEFMDLLVDLISPNINIYELFYVSLNLILQWLLIIMSAYLAIILIKTLLANKRFTGFISFIFFIVITSGLIYFSSVINNYLSFNLNLSETVVVNILSIINLLICGIIYIICGRLVDKNLSL
ncbi:MAG: hypothetical protein ACLFMO_05700 [Eubacteriales bacterium]